MAEIGILKKYKDGEMIFDENTIGNEMYIIKQGIIKIIRRREKREIVLATLGPGDFFGEMAIFTGQTRSAGAEALGDCALQVIDKERFLEIAKEPIVWRILERMSHRIREFDDEMEDLLIEDDLRKVVKLFRRYVAPQVVDEILRTASTEAINLSGELRVVTVVFADIRDFTSIAEKLKPREVVDLLNTYLGQMTRVVFRYEGTVDKYIGDAIMAVFNAPVEQVDHEWLSVCAAFQMREMAEHLKKANSMISIGIGVNSGSAVIGNIGTDLHLDYTVTGDAVNVASRLCRAAKPGQLLITENTYEKTKEHVEVEPPETRRFKGKDKPIKVYNVVGLRSDIRSKGGEDARGTRAS